MKKNIDKRTGIVKVIIPPNLYKIAWKLYRKELKEYGIIEYGIQVV